MAWYLNELLTEVHVLPGALYRLENYYLGEKLQRRSRAWRSFYRYLRTSGLNLGLIDNAYPLKGKDNLYHLLTDDLGLLIRKLGLIEPSDTIELTGLGKAFGNQAFQLESIVASGLLSWRSGRHNTCPVRLLVSVLHRLHELKASPCAGLMLPEFIKVMRMLEHGEYTADFMDDCIDAIVSWRTEATGGTLPALGASHEETIAARMRICDYLAGQDETVWDDLQRGRTMEAIILSSGLALYGGLLDRVQFMIYNPHLLYRFIGGITDYPVTSGYRDRISPPDIARQFDMELRRMRYGLR